MAILAEVIWGEAVLQRTRRRPLSNKRRRNPFHFHVEEAEI
jgi:hypothetical protein